MYPRRRKAPNDPADRRKRSDGVNGLGRNTAPGMSLSGARSGTYPETKTTPSSGRTARTWPASSRPSMPGIVMSVTIASKRRSGREPFERGLAVRGIGHRVPVSLKGDSRKLADGLFVLDEQNGCAATRGPIGDRGRQRSDLLAAPVDLRTRATNPECRPQPG